MKKTISLLISIAFIFTLILPVYAADVQIKPTNVIMDMTAAQLVDDIMGTASTDRLLSLDGVVNHAVQFRHRSLTNAMESYAGYNNVVEYGRTKDSDGQFIVFYTGNTVDDRPAVTNGQYEISARFRTEETLGVNDWYINYGAATQKKISMEKELLPDVWYNLEFKLDLNSTSDNVRVTMVPELESDAEIAENTIEQITSYAGDNMSTVRLYAKTQTAAKKTYWAQIKVLYYSEPYNKAEILSVGSDGEVDFDQNNVSFVLSEEIPGLSKEHVSIINAGGQDIEIASMEVTADGENHLVNLTTQLPLSAWTQYELTIAADAWGEYSYQIENGEETAITDISAEFHTASAPFDMKDPVFTLNDGILSIDTCLINTTGTPGDVTIMMVIYGEDGRVKSLVSETYSAFEAAYPGSDKHIELPFSSGETIKVFVANGWNNRAPMFGKYWETSFSELN